MAFLDGLKSGFSGGRGKTGAQSIISPRALVLFALGILLSIVAIAGLFYIADKLESYSKTYASLVNEQKVLSQQVANQSLEASLGVADAFVQLKRVRARFISHLNKLQNGDAETGLPPIPEALRPSLQQEEKSWKAVDENVRVILDARESIETVRDYVQVINESLPELLVLSDDVVKILIKNKAPRKDIALASRQLALIQSVQNSLNQITSGGEQVMAAADQFGRETALIERILIAMLEGSKEMGISQFTGDELVDKLLQLADLFSVVKKNVNHILENSPVLFEVRDAADQVQSLTPKLQEDISALEQDLEQIDTKARYYVWAAYAAALLAILLLMALGVQLIRGTRRLFEDSMKQNESNQRAILRLLDEMTNLADGDLSTHATVTEDITGAIADSVNYSIDALRDLVSTINQTAEQVSGAVNKTQATTRELAQSSELQATEIAEASEAITGISEGMSKVSENASDSADVARNSVNIAHKGGETVRKTIQGMEAIREQIQETSKRIKRLGESSQEIGDIVSLITEISDQTNILALNAAIQASMAGEAGRGFAVVADEVQRLAERTGDATKQIEALVKTIQADTNEAIASMEQSTSHVVEGANLAEDAGSALEKIETVSTNLAQRILQISKATQKHASESVAITETMGSIEQISLKTSRKAAEASESIGELTHLVKALRRSVAGFKLPGDELAESTVMHTAEAVNDEMEIEIEAEQA